ncbi:MAG: rod shape-determining protein MreD [Candidatus Cloacimonetes bacterium]|jgi:rod shape-determining protein MreD|nr:rod shape-determining protein MreD [Candidatus Cloacimonadota bacterium]MBT4575403.1 rod shape-determining protein MreD [Candidatus Cloacimonadota bacterium]
MRTAKYAILGVLILYFQLIIAHHFALYSIIPIFFIAYFAFISIRINAKFLLPLAFILGLGLDIMYPPLLGINTISFVIISFLVNKFHMNVNKQRFIIVSVSILFLNFFHYSILMIYHVMASQVIDGFVRLYFFSILYNTLISIIVVYVLTLSDKIKINLNV